MLTIGETASPCAVSARMLRHRESVGLLHPERDGNGYRLYGEHDIAHIRRIRLYRDLEPNVEQIGAALGQPTKETVALLRMHRDSIEQRIPPVQETLQGIDAPSGHARHNAASMKSTDKEDDMQQQADLDAMQAVERELAQAMRQGVDACMPGETQGSHDVTFNAALNAVLAALRRSCSG